MYTYKLTLSYIGTAFCGWQIQPNSPTIQEKLQDALKILLKTSTKVIGSGRTDAGVHAIAQVAHFNTEQKLDIYTCKKALNSLLPKEIRITDICLVDDTFHALKSACAKMYVYHLHLGSPLPFLEPFVYSVPKLDIPLLEKSAKYFIGTHDFTTFTNKPCKNKDHTRTLYALDVVQQNSLVSLHFLGNGFLYKMVRNITGTLLAIQQGKLTVEDIPQLFEKKDRTHAPMPANAKGLFLKQVFYDEIPTKISSNELKMDTFSLFSNTLTKASC
ncbi:MAG: tRNA pseudouridine synthase A [Chlamydiae bacterium]|nr:tRNA pseudouridine synthase A [Chlamydiota bacterium]